MKMKTLLAGSTLLVGMLLAQAAAAEDGYVTRKVSLRAGPGNEYPAVVSLRRNAVVDINGCINGWNWCDVDVGGYRGWVPGSYLQTVYNNRRYGVINAQPAYAPPIISFNIVSYWDNNYRARPFYKDRERWHKGWDNDRRDNDHNWNRDDDRRNNNNRNWDRDDGRNSWNDHPGNGTRGKH